MATIKYVFDTDNEELKLDIRPTEPFMKDGNLHFFYITDVYIDTEKTFVCMNEPSECALHKTVPEEEDSRNVGCPKNVHLIIDKDDILVDDWLNSLLFTFVKETEIILGDDTYGQQFVDSFDDYLIIREDPTEVSDLLYKGEADDEYCTTILDEPVSFYVIDSDIRYTFKILYHKPTLLKTILSNISILEKDDCKADCSDVNTMLAWYGFNLSVAVTDVRKALYYWGLLHEITTSVTTSPCNCK